MILKNILKKKVNNKDKKKSMRVGVELLYKILKCTEKLIIKGIILPPDTGSKLGKEYVKAVHCHPAYLTYMQSTSCKMQGWMKPKLELRLPGEISITSDTQMTPPYGRKRRGTKEPLDEGERGE